MVVTVLHFLELNIGESVSWGHCNWTDQCAAELFWDHRCNVSQQIGKPRLPDICCTPQTGVADCYEELSLAERGGSLSRIKSLYGKITGERRGFQVIEPCSVSGNCSEPFRVPFTRPDSRRFRCIACRTLHGHICSTDAEQTCLMTFCLQSTVAERGAGVW